MDKSRDSLRRGLSALCVLAVGILVARPAPAHAQTCSDGTDGTVTVAPLSTVVLNRYFPAPLMTTRVAIGSRSIAVDDAAARGAAGTIATGDLLLIIQLQGADFDSRGDAVVDGQYGDGPGGNDRFGFVVTPEFLAGRYELNRAAGPIAAGAIPLLAATRYVYENADTPVDNGDGTGRGVRRYQVVRIPELAALTVDLTGTLEASPWDGRSGGIVWVDAAGAMAINGTVSATGRGFRGGSPTIPTVLDDPRPGFRGEGIGGTPTRTFSQALMLTTRAATGLFGTESNRGAPANAGGAPLINDSGGGGGGGFGEGGEGAIGPGNMMQRSPPNRAKGADGLDDPTRLFLGGGGGSGTLDDPTPFEAVSGQAGGGIIVLRAASIAGIGSIVADGEGSRMQAQEGSGGGGGGGNIVLFSSSTTLAGLTIAARGGSGTSTNTDDDAGGGGGGGGRIMILHPTAAAVTFTAIVTGGPGGDAPQRTSMPPRTGVAGNGGLSENRPTAPTDLGCPGGDNDRDGVPDRVDVDDDNDGALDVDEGRGRDPGLDTDADGVPDYADTGFAGFTDTNADGIDDRVDRDRDGIPNHLDLDSDNDGLPDTIENGNGELDGNRDGVLDSTTDADNDGLRQPVDASEGGRATPNPDFDTDTVPDYLDADTDADGMSDTTEAGGADSNGDGRVDVATDTDRDGLADVVDPVCTTGCAAGTPLPQPNSDMMAGPDWRDVDSDGDSAPDSTEGHDADFNGRPDTMPAGRDADGDGFDDAFDVDCTMAAPCMGTVGRIAAFANLDGDALANFRDPDDDGDGLSTMTERPMGTDQNTDGDAFPDYLDADDDGDSVPTTNERPGGMNRDTDSDMTPDHLDPDDDGDTIPTLMERPGGMDRNTDGDANPDHLDPDDDGDTIPTATEVRDETAVGGDVDRDTVPAFLDTDSDAEGGNDMTEGTGDSDMDGVPNYLDPTETPRTTDADGDGFCSAGQDMNMDGDCDDPGEMVMPGDCNDGNAAVFPGAVENCTNMIDDNCNMLIDAADPACFVDPMLEDMDGDGFCPAGTDTNMDGDCADPGEMTTPGDCDDTRSGVNPDAVESCENTLDDDCDGLIDAADPDCGGPNPDTQDMDGDGFCPAGTDTNMDGDCADPGEMMPPGDCDDTMAPVNPDATEICTNTIDDDCDGFADAADPDCGGPDPDTLDMDGDGFCPDGSDVNMDGDCTDEGEMTTPGDCDDEDAMVNPDETEICDNTIDDDCDGDVDADDSDCMEGPSDDELDMDGDGTCPAGRDRNDDGDCADTGEMSTPGDCNDMNAMINPDADEICTNGQDDDCDGDIDLADSECVTDDTPLGWSGGACSAASGSGSSDAGGLLTFGLLGLALAFVRRRRRMGVIAALAVLGMLLLAGSAQAQSTLDRYRPAETTTDGFAISRPDDQGHMRFGVWLHLDYANDPLVVERIQGDPDSEEGSIVSDHLVAHFGAALGVARRVVLFIGVPASLVMDGEEVLGQPTADGSSLGDPFLGARLRLVGEQRDAFGLALQLTLTMPLSDLASSDQQFAGEATVTGTPELIAEVRAGRLRLTANVGARFRGDAGFDTVTIGHDFTFGAGATITLQPNLLDAMAELYGTSTFEEFGNRESTPLEWLLGLKLYPTRGLALGLAGGGGITRGFGSPDFRAVFMVGFTQPEAAPAPEPEPEPEPPRGPGDRDRDGLNDDVDECPDEPEDMDDFEDTNGCPDPDNDQDTILDTTDQCRNDPEDRDGFEDENGCPDPDNDQDTVLDADDRCPTDPGPPENQGCPRVILRADRIEILQRIEFEVDRDVLLPVSIPILEDVRRVMEEHPEILRIRVEGHTDDQGSARHNDQLSRRRARSVVRWLTQHGIATTRLAPQGFGERRPIEPNDSDENRQRNRRVEFHIVDPPPPAGDSDQTVRTPGE